MTSTDPRTTLIVYSRPGCHLCDDAEMMLRDELDQRASQGLLTPTVVRVDITTDAELNRKYMERLPVFAIGEDEVDLVTRSRQIRELLDRALRLPA